MTLALLLAFCGSAGAMDIVPAPAGVQLSAPGATISIGGLPVKLAGSATYYDYTTVPTTTTTAGRDISFATYTVAGGAIDRNGMCVLVNCSYDSASNANTKAATIRINQTDIVSSLSSAGNNTAYILNMRLCRSSSSTAIWSVTGGRSANTTFVDNQGSDADALNWNADVSIACAASAATSDGDMSFVMMKVSIEP